MSALPDKRPPISSLNDREAAADDSKPSKSLMNAFIAQYPGLADVETLITSSLGSDAKMLTEIGCYLQKLGGKRIRPLLTLVAARLCGMPSPSAQLVTAASGIELIHMATLLHDDIIDESPTRRSQESAYRRYGLPATLLAGDFLLVKAFGLCATLDRFVITSTERACIELTEGELLEGHMTAESGFALEQYLDVIRKKTASLFHLSCSVGAHIAGAEESRVAAMGMFGEQAGIAFQMIDDILDVVADEDLLGKPVGTDLRQKTPSLVNLIWLNSFPEEAKKFFSIPEPSAEDCRLAVEWLRNSSVISEARAMARQWADDAKASLKTAATGASDTSPATQLEWLLEYTLNRCL
ncbi:MAG: polyprenyl synthetase family protein [bacterium]|nr:polyprenyl synthetase family protein [bacterium]